MRTIGLLFLSNLFMTTAWYWHLKFRDESIWKVILISWFIALFEYCLAVPGNRVVLTASAPTNSMHFS